MKPFDPVADRRENARVLITACPASPRELAAIAELEQRVVAHDGGRLKLEWGVLPTPAVTSLLQWHGDRLIGFVGLYAFGPPTVELAGMVDPAARRTGVGTALLQAALPLCREREYGTALLVTPTATPAGGCFARAAGAELHHSEHFLVLGATPTGPTARPDVSWREACAADLPLVRGLLAAGFGHDPGELTMHRELGDTTMVIHCHDELVGTLRLSRRDGVAGIYGFVVHPDRQGAGIGRDVLARACRLLRAEGYARVTLEVATENDRALGLYTATGFVQETTEDYWAVTL